MRSIVRVLVIAAATATAAAGLATAQETDRLVAEVITASGEIAGTVTFRQAEHGVVIRAELANLPQGLHGLHIHQRGACQPDFQAAGEHYAPEGSQHGYDNPEGYHAGDLPNVHVAADGTAVADFFVPRLTLAPGTDPSAAPYTLRDQDGSAVMIHEGGDSYMAESGTGARIACGVIAPPQE